MSFRESDFVGCSVEEVSRTLKDLGIVCDAIWTDMVYGVERVSRFDIDNYVIRFNARGICFASFWDDPEGWEE